MHRPRIVWPLLFLTVAVAFGVSRLPALRGERTSGLEGKAGIRANEGDKVQANSQPIQPGLSDARPTISSNGVVKN